MKCDNNKIIRPIFCTSGIPGPTGPRGPIGPIGPSGISDTIEIGTTTTGEPGTQASVVDRTGSPHHILDFIVPQGPTGPGEGTSNIYGGLYNSRVQFLPFTAINQYLQAELNTSLPLSGVTAGNNTLTIQENGIYEISYNTLISSSKAIDLGIAVRKTGTVIPETRGSQTLSLDSSTTLTYDGRLSGTTFISLVNGDVLDLAICVLNTLPSGVDVIMNNNINATLTVKKIG